MNLRVASCRGCGAQIVWARTAKGRPIPLDARPSKMAVLRPIQEMPLDGDHAGDEQAQADIVDVYMPHHATCPKAADFRKPKTS